jgi:hypothetical protein
MRQKEGRMTGGEKDENQERDERLAQGQWEPRRGLLFRVLVWGLLVLIGLCVVGMVVAIFLPNAPS